MTGAGMATYRQVMDLARRPAAWAVHGVRGTDALLAAGLAFAFTEPGFDPYHHSSGTLWAATGLIAAAALAWRRPAPRQVWVITTAASVSLLLTRHGPEWGGLSPLLLIPTSIVALYTVASQTTRATGQLLAAISGIVLEASLVAHTAQPEAVASTATLVVSAWAVGDGVRSRREGIGALRDRARALEAERSERDLRAAADERARIARELHDIVAHHVSVISLQAGTARLLAESGGIL